MRRTILLFSVAVVVCALGTTMAASSYANVEALNSEAKPTTALFNGTNSKKFNLSILRNSLEVLCGKTVSEGTIEAGGKLGTFHVSFESCDTSLGGLCTGLGETLGTILALGTIHLAANSGLTVGFFLFLTEHLHFSCTVLGVTKLFLVLGEYLCGVTPINALVGKLTIKCEKGAEKGDPRDTSYENDKGEAATLTNSLRTGEGEGLEEMSAEEGEAEITILPEVHLDI